MKKTVRKGLTPAKVLDAAFRIVDARGGDALTMRALAARLNVAPMAIYNHFPDREAIVDALAERAFTLPPPALGQLDWPIGKKKHRWKDRLRAIIGSVQALAMRHPHVFRLAMSRPTKPGSGIRLMAEAMAALRDAGLSDAQAVKVYHTFILLFHGLPVWRETLEKYCGNAAPIAPGVTPSPQTLADWSLIHGSSPNEQFTASVEWLLDSIRPQKKRKN